ncbi:hypothetical protein BTVI_86188 [Pitangus sulphuratus]|nr:hypothetical protein BTVI_86188 [Pitangus sulphuratus]
MVTLVSGLDSNPQTDVVAWLQTCLVPMDLPWRPGVDRDLAGVVRNQQPRLHFDREDGPGETGLMLNLPIFVKGKYEESLSVYLEI